MSELTKEYFEQHLKAALASLATKQDVREGVDELARIASAGFSRTEDRLDEIARSLDVSAQLKAFERKFQKLEEALHITL